MSPFFEEEFWGALNRLYEKSIEFDGWVDYFIETTDRQQVRLNDMEVMIEELQQAVNELRKGRTE